MISQIVYVSLRDTKCTNRDIIQLVKSGRRKNRLIGITSVLLYSSTRFIQVLEGDNFTVPWLYDRIRQDYRHKNVTLINYVSTAERSFPNWYMKAMKINFESKQFRSKLDKNTLHSLENFLLGKWQKNAPFAIKQLLLNKPLINS